jgi:uncharacterized membrane protein HdeD (DUF308 family)
MATVADEIERRLIRRGSIPLFVHGLLEYGLGILCIAAPFLFSFETDGATVLSIVIGTAVLAFGIVTAGPTGIVRSLPLDSHIVLDYVLGIFLLASPFVFGLTDDGPALAYFLVVGVGHLLLTIVTRFRKQPKHG